MLRWIDFRRGLTGVLFDSSAWVAGTTAALFEWSYSGGGGPLVLCGGSNWARGRPGQCSIGGTQWGV
jgi:hypothetical protein